LINIFFLWGYFLKSYIDDIIKIEPLSRVDPVKNTGEVKPLKEGPSGPFFNDLLLENIKKFLRSSKV